MKRNSIIYSYKLFRKKRNGYISWEMSYLNGFVAKGNQLIFVATKGLNIVSHSYFISACHHAL